jgi:hypothetical protein
MAGTTGLEPATSAVTGQRSNQLSYVPKQPIQFNRTENAGNRQPPVVRACPPHSAGAKSPFSPFVYGTTEAVAIAYGRAFRVGCTAAGAKAHSFSSLWPD